ASPADLLPNVQSRLMTAARSPTKPTSILPTSTSYSSICKTTYDQLTWGWWGTAFFLYLCAFPGAADENFAVVEASCVVTAGNHIRCLSSLVFCIFGTIGSLPCVFERRNLSLPSRASRIMGEEQQCVLPATRARSLLCRGVARFRPAIAALAGI